jgi:hypothetical protein
MSVCFHCQDTRRCTCSTCCDGLSPFASDGPCAACKSKPEVLAVIECPVIEITAEDLKLCYKVAEYRINEAIRLNRGRGHGEKGHSIPVRDLPGACGELVVSKTFHVPFDAFKHYFAKGDLPYGIEIRATKTWTGHLFVFDEDDGTKNCNLVVLDEGLTRGKLVGWAYARDARRPRYRRIANANIREGSAPQCWIPQSELTAGPSKELVRYAREVGEKRRAGVQS